MALPNLPDEILIRILEILGDETFYNFGRFMRAGKRGYALVHERSVLKKCSVYEMYSELTCQIREGCRYPEFHLKCVSAGNTATIFYEGLFTTPSIGLEESIKILEPNVPMHGPSTLAVDIFNVCLGNDKEASKLFQEFAAYHHDLRSDRMADVGETIEYQLRSFGAEDLNCNKYDESFKFPDDGVIKLPSCFSYSALENLSNFHDYIEILRGGCKNCKLFCICLNISHIL